MSTPMEQEAVTEHSPSPAKGETIQPDVIESSDVYEAAAQGDMEFLETHKSEIGSFVTPTKNTILHIYIIAQSIRNRDTNIVQKLQSAIKSVPSWFKYATDKPSSPAKTVQAMLKEWPWLLHKANESGDTPLHMAARHGEHDIVKVLIDHAKNSPDVGGEDVEGGQVVRTKVEHAVWKMLHETNSDKETALHQAVRYQHNDAVKVLVDEDDPSFMYLPNEDGETPLYMAAERNNNVLVCMILERYTSPGYEGPDGRTALHAAAIHSSDAWYDIVTKEGLKCLAIKVDNRGRTPLHYDSVLLRYDRSAAFITDNDGKTALHVASGDKERLWDVWWFISNCPECFELVDGQGRNALHIAVESGNKEAVDLILKHEYFGDLLKKKDNNGNTPLHLLAAFPNYWPDMIKDHRFDKMAFNKHKLNPVDIISSNQTPSKVEKSMAKRMEKADFSSGRRASTNPVTKTNVEENNRSNKSDDEDLKEARESHLVVAALIATVTFAAGFTLPGGYIQEKGKELGYAVFTKNAAFIVFVISDTFGLVFSCAAVFIHLLMVIDGHKEKQTVGKLFGKALPLTLFAIVAMVIAFISGTYAVLAHSPSLAIPASVIGAVFFFLFGYLMEEAHQNSDSFRIFHGMIHMAELLLSAIVRSFMAFEELLMALWHFYELTCSGIVKVFKWCYPGASKDDKPEDSKRFLERQRSLHRPFDS